MQPNTIAEGDALARYGANMLPVDYTPARPSSPIFNYPYARSREALEQLYRNGPRSSVPRRQDAVRQPGDRRLSDADDRRVHAVAAGGVPRARRIARPMPPCYCVVEGRGRTRIGDTTFDWGPRDIFVVPSWAPVSHEAERGGGAVQLLRPPRAEGARPLARAGRRYRRLENRSSHDR